MSKAYPSNLTLAQYECLSDLLPAAKLGGRPQEVDLWDILNAIFYILVEGVLIKGCKRFLTVDTLGLVLRVFVTAASTGEREGGKAILERVRQRGKAVFRLHTVWVDGGSDGATFIQWIITFCHWLVQVVLRPEQ